MAGGYASQVEVMGALPGLAHEPPLCAPPHFLFSLAWVLKAPVMRAPRHYWGQSHPWKGPNTPNDYMG